MANDHYAICEEKKEYTYLGEFYEWDCQNMKDVRKLLEDDETYIYRFEPKKGPGLWFVMKFLMFQKRHNGRLVKVVHENYLSDLWMDNPSIDWEEVLLNDKNDEITA